MTTPFSTRFLIPIVTFTLVSSASKGQDSRVFSNDEKSRISFAVHLLTYDTVASFESALGEAYFKALVHSVENAQSIIPAPTNLKGYDLLTCLAHAQRFQGVIENPPTWEFLFAMEEQYLKWLDTVVRKKSKYKS